MGRPIASPALFRPLHDRFVNAVVMFTQQHEVPLIDVERRQRKVEVSLTQIFRQPVYGRRVFEAMLRENLDLGRPDRVSLVFPTRLTRATPPPRQGYHTRVLT